MFDIGFWEMLVIGVMALVILGPERLPGAIKSTMSTVRSIKQMATGFKDEVASQIDAHELHQNLKKAEELGMQNIGKDLQDSVNELKAAAKSVQRPYELPDKPEPDTSNENEKPAPEQLQDQHHSNESQTSENNLETNSIQLNLDANNHQEVPVPITQQTEQISLLLDDEPDSQNEQVKNDSQTGNAKQPSGKA